MTPLIVSEQALRASVPMDLDALTAVESAFASLAQGRVTMPPILHLEVPAGPGEVDVKTAYVDGLDSFAVKVASGFFENDKLGLPTGNGMMVVLSARSGVCEAVLLDNGYLTDLRTALAGAVSAKYLAPDSVKTVGVYGAGIQARWQVEALTLVREFESVTVYARNKDQAIAYAADMRAILDRPVVIAERPEEMIADSQLVVTTTPSREPIVHQSWTHPGLHITAMGSDGPGKRELQPELAIGADLLVVDRKTQSQRLGELQDIPEEHTAAAIELGQVIIGAHAGRTSSEQLTVADLTGTGVQDTAIATFALSRLNAG